MRRRLLVLLALVAALAPGCSLGPRQTWAEAMRRSEVLARRRKTGTARITVQMKVVETVIRQPPTPLWTDLFGRIDYRRRRAQLDIRSPGHQGPVVFDDLVVYLPRSAGARAAKSPNRHWVRFDFKAKPKERIDTTDRRWGLGLAMISPELAIELLHGVLAGSVERVAAGVMRAGVPTTEYSARLAPDAAVRDLTNEGRRTGILRLFETLGVRQDVFPVKVWLDAEGLVRAVQFVMDQERDPVDIFRTTLTFEYPSYGDPAEVVVPRASDSLTARRFGDFVVEYLRQG